MKKMFSSAPECRVFRERIQGGSVLSGLRPAAFSLLILSVLFFALPVLSASLSDAQRFDAYLTLAEGFSEQGDYKGALAYIEKSLPLCPPGDIQQGCELWHRKAYLHFMLEEYDKALLAAQSALALDSGFAQAYLLRGQVYAGQGENALAAEELQLYMQLVPGDSVLLSSLGELYMSLDKFEDAIHTFTLYLSAVQQPDLRVNFLRGICLMNDGEFSAAAEDFTAASEHPELRLEALYNRGMCWLQTQEYSKALEEFSECIAGGVQIDGLHFNRGVCYMALSDFSKAAEDFTASLLAGQLPDESLYNRGICYLQEENYQASEIDFSLLMDHQTYRGNALYFRGLSRAGMENYSSAVEDFTQSLETEAAASWNLYQRANCFFALRDYEKAIADHTANIEHGELLSLSYYGRSQCYKAQKLPDLAQADLLASLAAEEVEAAAGINPTPERSE